MKKLTQEELLNLSTEKAWEVVQTFADYLQKPNRKYLEFDNTLDYEKDTILICLLHLIKENIHNKDLVEVLCTNITILITQFIPDEQTYHELLQLKNTTDKYGN